MIKPYYEEPGIVIWNASCFDILPLLKDVQIVCSDPPWGSKTKCNAQRFTRNKSPWWKEVDTSKIRPHDDIRGDDEPFDPSPWIRKHTILWGANHYASKLPDSGGWLIWDKRIGAEQLAEKGWPLGEAELAWTNVRGSTRVFRKLWSGLLRTTERGEFYHPTQKPLSLMRWCIGFLPEGTILDPFMGSGSTIIAAKQLGRRAIGIEIEQKYCDIAIDRLRQEVLPLNQPESVIMEQEPLL